MCHVEIWHIVYDDDKPPKTDGWQDVKLESEEEEEE